MNTSTNGSNGSNGSNGNPGNSTHGGRVAIRGLLVQTLVALLDIAQAEPPFTSIALEADAGQEQFDFAWQDQSGRYAVQVKSSINQFSHPDVTRWAEEARWLAFRDQVDVQ